MRLAKALLNRILMICLITCTILQQGNAMISTCEVPNCPEGCGEGMGPSNDYDKINLKRTFLDQKMSKMNRKRNSVECIDPSLDISITAEDFAAFLAVGNRRLQLVTDTSQNLMMDVGVAGEDTQFWDIPFMNFAYSSSFVSIQPDSSPYIDEFPDANVVYKGQKLASDTVYVHSRLQTDEFVRNGMGVDNFGDPYILDWYETEAFLPVECGWEIIETITTIWAFDPDIDSLVETKNLTIRATGMLTPLNEDPVPAVLAYQEYSYSEFKDGLVIQSGGYRALVWFTTKGHRLVGYLADGAPIEGVTQFRQFGYEENIVLCPEDQDLGVSLHPGSYKANNQLASGAQLLQGPVLFKAGQEILLKPNFSTSAVFEAEIDPNACLE